MQRLVYASPGIAMLCERVQSAQAGILHSLWEVLMHLLEPNANERWTLKMVVAVFRTIRA